MRVSKSRVRARSYVYDSCLIDFPAVTAGELKVMFVSRVPGSSGTRAWKMVMPLTVHGNLRA